jgi:DNA-directed RNA polymerase subunit K/omega
LETINKKIDLKNIWTDYSIIRMSDNESIENENEQELDEEQLEEEGVEETKGGDNSESETEEVLDEDENNELPYDDDELPDVDEYPDDEEVAEDKSNITKPSNKLPNDNAYKPFDDISDESDNDSESESESEYIPKVDLEKKVEYIKETHPQEISKTYEEMIALTRIKRKKNKTDGEDIIIDDKHTTVPILTKYEKTRILGIRVSQLNEGAPRYINFGNEHVIIDNNVIAEKELRMKKLPFIISRPLPNGEKEHWRLQDLEIL